MLQGVNQGNLVRWIWIRYKGLCDLYVMMVTHFLFFEKRFTYDDLKRLVDNKVISSSWEEDIWRNLIAQRPENRNATVPDPFISR
ncbi:MAG: hypothetical protein KAW02_04230 [candidate division Zixibacteria bacterium]|nr:hypothetical protein [candidate division Zixibacteria bacterium]